MNALSWSNGELFSGCSSMQKVLMPNPPQARGLKIGLLSFQAEEENSSVKRIGAHLQATAIEKRKRYNIASVMTVRPQRSQLVWLSFP